MKLNMSNKLKYIKFQEDFSKSKKVNESAWFDEENSTYKVNLIVDIPTSFLNSYVKKVKDEAGKDIRNNYGNEIMAEELVKYICKTYLNVDIIPVNALINATPTSVAPAQGPAQAQDQEPSEETPTDLSGDDVQFDEPTQVQGQAQGQGQVQVQSQAQVQGGGDDFETAQVVEDLPI